MMNEYLKNHVQIKPIFGFLGYFVDNFGVVYTSKVQGKFQDGSNAAGFKVTDELRPLKPWMSGKSPVPTVTLWNGWNNNRGFKRKVHLLVMETFCGPRPTDMECCHNDGNPMNNRLENLRWDTHRGNMSDTVRHGTSNRGDRHPLRKLSIARVRDIKSRLSAGESPASVAALHKTNRAYIYRIKAGVRWGHVE